MEKVIQSEYSEDDLTILFEELWAFNRHPNLDKKMGLSRFKQEVMKEGVCPHHIIKQYDDYLKVLDPHQNDKYTKKEFQIKDIYDFINQKLYLNELKVSMPRKPERENYLYGI
jgi:hypothetical protein